MQQVRVRDEQFQKLRNEALDGLAAVSRDANKAKDVYAKLIAQCALSLNEKVFIYFQPMIQMKIHFALFFASF